MPRPDAAMQAKVVQLILNRETERALEVLGSLYNIKPPRVGVGTVKGRRRTAYAVYVPKERKIYAMDADIFYNPFVILHEFYHHLRTQGGPQRGTERHANLFAQGFIDSYRRAIALEKAAGRSAGRTPPA